VGDLESPVHYWGSPGIGSRFAVTGDTSKR